MSEGDSSRATNAPSALAELVIRGFSGTAAKPLVIINDRTFAEGDEKELATPHGRARVRCIQIRVQEEAVLLEANRERRELHPP